MGTRRIAVIGASGFVGATVVEHLLASGGHDVVPFIHSSGNAWRLTRLGIPLTMLDLLDRDQVTAAMRGVTHVVNCSRGGDALMITGLRNLLAAGRTAGVQRFVHLGSVAVYGDPPPPESVREAAPTIPAEGSYGAVKLQQDRMVEKAHREGLPSLILCPPNISGVHSVYLLGILAALRDQSFALLEDGSAPCNLVDVRNLAHAVERAFDCNSPDGTRYFVTDPEVVSWRDVIDSLTPLAELRHPVPSVTRDVLEDPDTTADAKRSISVIASLKHLVSSEVREALRADPLWRRVDIALRRMVARLGTRAESALRLSVEGPIHVGSSASGSPYATPIGRQQLRGIRHSCDRARVELGYAPPYTFADSVRAFSAWYRDAHGMDTPWWPLLRSLDNH